MAVKLIFHYLWWCLKLWVSPWRYYQLNSKYFDEAKGYYSKLDIDKIIPKQWLLKQNYFNIDKSQYRVFIKPEWGQNANGIIKINTLKDFENIKNKINKKHKKIPHIVQEMAKGKLEYEIFGIKNPQNAKEYITLSISIVKNKSSNTPINSINNIHTNYEDCTNKFSNSEINKIKNHLKQLPIFNIMRICIKTNSKKNLLDGIFSIIEINLFAPMPLSLLDKTISNYDKLQFIKKNMYYLVKLSSKVNNKYFKKYILLKIIISHFKSI